jgi:hypothetical protein
MHRFRRLALIGCCVLGYVAALAPGSGAASSVTTLPADFVTTTSATLHGSIDTGGQAVTWRFEYGAVSGLEANTPFLTIPAGQSATNYAAATINQLHPNTAYQFRLVAFFGVGSIYEVPTASSVLSFTTKPTGRLVLLARELRFAGRFASVPLNCRSRMACRGRLTIAVAKSGTVCVSKSFTIRPSERHTLFLAVRSACRSLLRAGHALPVRIDAKPTTGQTGVETTVKLIG